MSQLTQSMYSSVELTATVSVGKKSAANTTSRKNFIVKTDMSFPRQNKIRVEKIGLLT